MKDSESAPMLPLLHPPLPHFASVRPSLPSSLLSISLTSLSLLLFLPSHPNRNRLVVLRDHYPLLKLASSALPPPFSPPPSFPFNLSHLSFTLSPPFPSYKQKPTRRPTRPPPPPVRRTDGGGGGGGGGPPRRGGGEGVPQRDMAQLIER